MNYNLIILALCSLIHLFIKNILSCVPKSAMSGYKENAVLELKELKAWWKTEFKNERRNNRLVEFLQVK